MRKVPIRLSGGPFDGMGTKMDKTVTSFYMDQNGASFLYVLTDEFDEDGRPVFKWIPD